MENVSISDCGFSLNAEAFHDALVRVLLVNTTQKKLKVSATNIRYIAYCDWLDALFQCVADSNRTLESLEVGVDLTDERTRAALARMLKKNPVLEKLSLLSPAAPTEATMLHWREILPLLSANKTLKSLTVFWGGFDALVIPIPPLLLIEMIATLQANDSLERLVVASPSIGYEDHPIAAVGQILPVDFYIYVLSSLTPHTTPKELQLGPTLDSITDQETAQLVSLVKQNYWLEHLDPQVEALGEVSMWLTLNRASRRYLVGAEPTVAQGVAVLGGVSDDLDCVFTHLLENPLMCEIKGDDELESGHDSKRPRVGDDASVG